MEVLLLALGGETAAARVSGPLGDELTAGFALLEARRRRARRGRPGQRPRRSSADERRDAEAASTRGTGELIAPRSRPAPRSCSSPPAAARRPTAAPARSRRSQDAGGLRGAALVVLCDVRTPFERAARTFGPQKGADAAAVKRLARAARARSRAAAARPARRADDAARPAGSRAGCGRASAPSCDAGAPFVLEALGSDARMRAARALVVGEGRLDETTLQGKVAGELATRARQSGVPCHAIVGSARARPLRARGSSTCRRVQEAGSVEALEAAGEALARVPIERAARYLHIDGRAPPNPRALDAAPRRRRRRGLVRHGRRRAAGARRPAHDAADAHAGAGGRCSPTARENAVYLPEVELPPELRIESADVGLARYDLVFLGVPSRRARRGGRRAALARAEARAPPSSRSPRASFRPTGARRRPCCASSTERSASPSSAARRTRARWSTRAPGSSPPPRTRSSRG